MTARHAWTKCAIATMLTIGLASHASYGQGGGPDAVLVGIVRDSSGVAIPLAQLVTSGIRATSDDDGNFAFRGLPGGSATLIVRRLGFRPLERSVELAPGRTDSVVIVLVTLPRELADVSASAEASLRLSEFYRHKDGGNGVFFDRKEIEEHRVAQLSDLLRRVPGVRVSIGRDGRRHARMGRSAQGRDCPPDMWIDGVRAASMSVDELPLADVEALEVYKGISTIPPEYNNRFGNPSCGSIVIWTRIPG